MHLYLKHCHKMKALYFKTKFDKTAKLLGLTVLNSQNILMISAFALFCLFVYVRLSCQGRSLQWI